MADMADTSTNTNESTDQSQEQALSLSNHKAKFKVETFNLKTPDLEEPIELAPECINRIVIIQDFDNNIQPIFKVDAVLPPLVINFILSNKMNVSINLRLQEIDYINAEEQFNLNGDWKTNGTLDICNDDFILFSADGTKVPNLSDYQKVAETITGQSQPDLINQVKTAGYNMSNYTQEYPLFLWKESDLYNLRKVVNAVYGGVTLGDAAASVLSDNGFQRVIMAPPDNGGTIDQLIIPPMYMMNVFEFLQTQYGMYSTDVNFFSDIYRTYVIDRSGEAKAYEDGEYTKTIFSIVKSTNELAQSEGTATLDEKFEFHNITDINKVNVRSLSEINDILSGNNGMFIDSNNNNVTSVNGAGSQRGSGLTNITIDQEGTQYNKQKMANMINEMNLGLQVNDYTDYNYTAFTPNKAFIFSFKDKEYYEYNGYYRLTRAIHVLDRLSSGDQMSITGRFDFVRKKELTEDERATIEYDVFKTAEVTEEGQAEAAAAADENNSNDSTYAQSEDNQVKEGLKDSGSSNQVSESTDNTPSTTVPSDSSSTTTTESSSSGYQQGSPAPVPLDER